MKRTLIIAGLVIVAATAVVMGDPTGPQSPSPGNPDPPTPPTPPGPQGGPLGDPEPLGAGCIGGEFQAAIFFAADGTLGITQREFYNTYEDGLWMRGTFDPTAAVSPCVAGCFD